MILYNDYEIALQHPGGSNEKLCILRCKQR